MNTLVFASLALLAAALPVAASSAISEPQLVRSHAVCSVGDYVERGTPRIQVIAKLGQPVERLSPDIWVYRHLGDPGDARAHATCRTLIIRFDAGIVAEMNLVNEPAVQQLAADLRARSPNRIVAANAAVEAADGR